MLMAGVLNSEVEKSVRHLTGRAAGFKVRAAILGEHAGNTRLATKRHTADPKTEKPSQEALARSGKRVKVAPLCCLCH
jgi:hypothetical protein